MRRLGLAAFHGPMVAVDLARGLTAAETDSLLGALAGDLPAALPVPPKFACRSAIPAGPMTTAWLGSGWSVRMPYEIV